MKEAHEKRVKTTTSVFALLSGLLTFGYIAILIYAIQLTRDLDKKDPEYGDKNFEFWCVMPFTIMLSLYAVLQLFSCVFILMFDNQKHSIRSTFYASILGLACSLGIASYLVIQTDEFNAITRDYPKQDDPLPNLIPTYYSIEIGGILTFTLILPMMAYIFYHKLEKYLSLGKAENQAKRETNSCQGVSLFLFVIQIATNIAAPTNLYVFSDIQDKKDFELDNAADIYTRYFFLAYVVQQVAIFLLIKDHCSPFLTKKKRIITAIILGIFQMSNVFIFATKGGELFVEYWVLGDDLCKFEDCEAAMVLRWEWFAYGVLNLLCVAVQMCFLKRVAEKADPWEQRETLMTTEEIQS